MFSPEKKRIYEKLRCNSTLKIRFGRKKILNYAYVLKNGVGWYNIFLNLLDIACWILLFVSFSYIICQCFHSSTIWLVLCAHSLHQQIMCKRFPEWVHCQVIYEYCAGKHWMLYWMQENQTATYFLRSRLYTYGIMKNFNCN